MDHFKKNFTNTFEVVCKFLGDGWRVDKLEPGYEYRIKLTSLNFKHFVIVATMEKGRIQISGGVSHGVWCVCSVSTRRQPLAIARDIKRKILSSALGQIELLEAEIKKNQKRTEEREIVKSSIGCVVELQPNYYDLCSFKHGRIHGTVKESYDGCYNLHLSCLSKDELIYLVGFLSTL
ncbi:MULTISPECIES: hypothetical protein [Photorhabdus]|uniref:Uncharacterized protein n=2 Tax=Photorhabdus TaxID=29487 RepID=A0A7C9GMH7_9GAMM|nr:MULTISPECIES: hypothetical protein [Photorhabdus]MQL50034.1 hypothetical protein [Photorhabdus khanii]MQL50131.1 hypothetical protein [Photorhabdus khanii]NHB98761.1 hypothetical protein [Photorhabdus stackebrandtii]